MYPDIISLLFKALYPNTRTKIIIYTLMLAGALALAIWAIPDKGIGPMITMCVFILSFAVGCRRINSDHKKQE